MYQSQNKDCYMHIKSTELSTKHYKIHPDIPKTIHIIEVLR